MERLSELEQQTIAEPISLANKASSTTQTLVNLFFNFVYHNMGQIIRVSPQSCYARENNAGRWLGIASCPLFPQRCK